MGAGRPPIFKDPEEMQQIIDAYFDKCKPELEKDAEGRVLTTAKGVPIIKLNPPTITGLALALGFNSRGTIYEYENKNDEFSDTVKNARLRCENWVEVALLSGTVAPAAGIFPLKNYGWKDTQSHEITDMTDYTKQYELLESIRQKQKERCKTPLIDETTISNE